MKTEYKVLAVFGVGALFGCMVASTGGSLGASAHAGGAQEKPRITVAKTPNGTVDNRYVYYPGTEVLGDDEIRITAAGTGMPSARRSQAATCFLIELGNGEKLLFDIGSGSHANLQALMIPADRLNKVFLTHLHTDHWADLTSLWAGGWTAGRTGPLYVWGPSGAREDMGTRYAVENLLKAFNWDYMTRAVTISPAPGEIVVEEFDYQGVNQVVYEENGVTIRSWPAIHSGDGPISFSLEWNGYKIVIGGDTAPNKWYLEYARDADLAIHEAFMTSRTFVNKYGQPPQLAARINLTFHTSAQAFGKIMSTVEPRHAVAFHFFNDEDTRYQVYDGIRETYDGPLSMGTDMMVWNVTRDSVVERMAVSPDAAWDVKGTGRPPMPDRSRKSEYTPFVLEGRYDTSDVDGAWLKEFMDDYGLSEDDLKVGG
jgi:ribonuclease Z